MSGGAFDYAQYTMGNIASQIEEMLASDSYFCSPISDETRAKFKETIVMLKKSEAMVQRIDWFVSGDDGEETFHRRWAEELSKIVEPF